MKAVLRDPAQRRNTTQAPHCIYRPLCLCTASLPVAIAAPSQNIANGRFSLCRLRPPNRAEPPSPDEVALRSRRTERYKDGATKSPSHAKRRGPERGRGPLRPMPTEHVSGTRLRLCACPIDRRIVSSQDLACSRPHDEPRAHAMRALRESHAVGMAADRCSMSAARRRPHRSRPTPLRARG